MSRPGKERLAGNLAFCLLLAASTAAAQAPPGQIKPAQSDLLKGSVYADNWFVLYVNGKLIAVDPIDFLPHNQVNVELLPEYPMTIAVQPAGDIQPTTSEL